jgi:hypothetical protein
LANLTTKKDTPLEEQLGGKLLRTTGPTDHPTHRCIRDPSLHNQSKFAPKVLKYFTTNVSFENKISLCFVLKAPYLQVIFVLF